MIGIHERPGSYSDRWIAYCTEKGVPFRRIDCLANDIVSRCQDLDALLWHWEHNEPASQLIARQIVASLERRGLPVFPNVNTSWHFDDKVAQKYLLEAIGAPIIPTWVFTDRLKAMLWIQSATWPKVFKLRCGAGSSNVRLVQSKSSAEALCRKAFGRGFPAVAGYTHDIGTRIQQAKSAREFRSRLARMPRTVFHVIALRSQLPRERGYLYFQEFLPANAFDTRITVIGDRAFGFMRVNRPNDFRASGSGKIIYNPDEINQQCVAIAFKVAEQLGTQSLCFDFLYDSRQSPKIAEISYCYMASAVHSCAGYWDRQGNWHDGHVWPEDAILEDMLAEIQKRRSAKTHE